MCYDVNLLAKLWCMVYQLTSRIQKEVNYKNLGNFINAIKRQHDQFSENNKESLT